MTVSEWAKNEIELLTKGKDNYTKSCAKNALDAYNVLMEAGHSGASFNLTRNYLLRLAYNLPLTPITDNDFDLNKNDFPKSFLDRNNLKSCIQCSRLSSLFRYEKINGEVYYSDSNRVEGIDISDGSNFSGGGIYSYVDDMFPIKMPYYPNFEKYKVYTETFLFDKNNGYFDHKAYLYIVTPSNIKIDIKKYFKCVNDEFIEITEDEYLNNKKYKIK